MHLVQMESQYFNGRLSFSRGSLNVALVSMPFYTARRPSIQLGLLKSLASREGFLMKTFHLNLDFAAMIGFAAYEALSGRRGHLGDWLFSTAAFSEGAPDADHRYLDIFHMEPLFAKTLSENALSPCQPECIRELLKKIRTCHAPAFIEQAAMNTQWNDFNVVGFSSTFQQNTASFALAKRIKQMYPHIITVFGGANFDGEMGLEFLRRYLRSTM